MNKRIKGAGVSALLAIPAIALVSAVGVAPAHAGTSCSFSTVNINTTAGGEGASTKLGHYHFSGTHYVYSANVPGTSYWYADNDNGSTDKPDTYYGSRAC